MIAALVTVGSAACSLPAPSFCDDGLAFCLRAQAPGRPFPYCLDLRSDPNNCGQCGMICPYGAICLAGRCACPPGESLCNYCVDLSTNGYNCGTCGTACGAGSCVGGSCVCFASPTVVQCGGSPVCVDTSTDPRNCGHCGTPCPLVGEACLGGSCACPSWRPDVCPAGATSACVDLLSDPRHCGNCATTCAANGVCTSGACACPSWTTLCTVGNVCADLASDANNCGACGAVCDGVCWAGSCQPAPPPSCGFLGEPCCGGGICYSGDCAGITCW